MPSRQREWQKRKRTAGECMTCGETVWANDKCFRCYLAHKFSKKRLTYYRKRTPGAWNRFVSGMAARFQRILVDEGFAVDAIVEPQIIIKLAGFSWAKGKLRKKVLEVIAEMDDIAIRRRFT
jgi:hypothetical protein